jgi:hypothetical protein
METPQSVESDSLTKPFFENLSITQLRDLAAISTTPGYQLLGEYLERIEKILKNSAFHIVPVSDTEKIMHGNLQGQKVMMDRLTGFLEKEVQEEISNREKTLKGK